MAVPLIAAVNPFVPEGLGPGNKALTILNNVFFTVTPSNLPSALLWIPAHQQYTWSVDVTALSSTADILGLLDAGVSRVFATYDQLKALQPTVNDSRLVLLLDTDSQSREKIIDAISDTSVGVYAHHVVDLDFIKGWLHEYGTRDRPPVYVSFATKPTLADVVSIAQLDAVPIVDAWLLTDDPATDTWGLPIAEIFMAGITSDRPDGLIPTVVTDVRGVALGLVYSSAESVKESFRTGTGVYQSRKRGLWYKGATSGATQELVHIEADCDQDCLRFVVRQKGSGFCHLETATCFGGYKGLSKLQATLQERMRDPPVGSYTKRLFEDGELLRAKIMEEAKELCEAVTKEEVAFEAADLIYFALTRCVKEGVALEDVERNLDVKSRKVHRRPGDAKEKPAEKKPAEVIITPAAPPAAAPPAAATEPPKIQQINAATATPAELAAILRRPAQKNTDIAAIVAPIIHAVRTRGDAALLEYAHRFDRATLTTPVLTAPFPETLMQLPPATQAAIDLSFTNIHLFHSAQTSPPLSVETMPGVICRRFSRPIESVGLYVPGGTAVLPSTALMLGVPALVAGCSTIVIATPPRPDGSVTPEIVYVAHKIGASHIVLAGGAQAVAALAYGTSSVPKVDKILGPGNQYVTAAKMAVSTDTDARVSIDMPAGPSEVLVVADSHSIPSFVAADLLSQAEHGVDSQVVLVTVAMDDDAVAAVVAEVYRQAETLPRREVVWGALANSVVVRTDSVGSAMEVSNGYAPEHLILQVQGAEELVEMVRNAGSVFVGRWTPESVGDYSAGVNHSLPTYGYARQYSGVNLDTFVKHITSSELTEEGLRNVGGAVMTMAGVEELEAHRRAVEIRLEWADSRKE